MKFFLLYPIVNFSAEENARLCIRKGERNKAAHHLRQKKRALSEMNAKDVQYQKLLDMLYQLGQTRQNKQIIDAYKAGADAFKATLHRQGIDPNKVNTASIKANFEFVFM